ncbi:uncharacterized protein GLRG_06493 [Colletotrichum graminicola M1.001]|uniref:Uncharacterized protein n=1 Tax=Colletotrichum graminicola (strain M1.001 / M2 / FGSC 10212) TaxID=645133 RepID=E3QKG1_COLGM|nr:uncharacterized protein GLRG_06493 [Colletotrichum graminicola M1.001]EFQ31349.1 hypothetical protein GLRG_06493 [Colletotrichum graminicola M1.001]
MSVPGIIQRLPENPSASPAANVRQHRPADVDLTRDARFSAPPCETWGPALGGGDAEMRALLVHLQSELAHPAANRRPTWQPQPSEAMHPVRPLDAHGGRARALAATRDMMSTASVSVILETVLEWPAAWSS